MVAFDTIIKGMHLFPITMLINANLAHGPHTFTTRPGVEAVGIYHNKGEMPADIAWELFAITTDYYICPLPMLALFFSTWRRKHFANFCDLFQAFLKDPNY